MPQPLPDRQVADDGARQQRAGDRAAERAARRQARAQEAQARRDAEIATRLRSAQARVLRDELLLEQGLPGANDPRWEGDPFADPDSAGFDPTRDGENALLVEEWDPREEALAQATRERDEAAAALAELTAALPGSDTATSDAVAGARERLRAAQVALAELHDGTDDAGLGAGLGVFAGTDLRVRLAQWGAGAREDARRYAQDAVLLTELAASVPRTLGDTRGATPWTSLLTELAVATGRSTRTLGRQIQDARLLVEHLPSVAALLRRGLLLVPAARALLDVAGSVADPVLLDVLDDLAQASVGLSPWKVREQATAALLAADPEQAGRRAARARRGRHVRCTPLPDEQAELTLVGPALPVGQAWTALCAQAEAIQRAGDPRTTDQLRHDLLLAQLVLQHSRGTQAETDTDTAAAAAPPDATPSGEVLVDPSTGEVLPDTGTAGPAGSDELAWEAFLAATDVLPHDQDREPDPTGHPEDGWHPRPLADLHDPHPPHSQAGHVCPTRPVVVVPPPDPTGPDWLTDRRLSRNLQVLIHVPVTTALGLDDEPGYLPGYGFLSAPTVRAWLPAAELRQLAVAAHGPSAGTVLDRAPTVTRPDPTPSGTAAALLAMATQPMPVTPASWQRQPGHDPSPALRALVQTRDRYDDGPTQPRLTADRTDFDHDTRHPDGPTAAWNGASRGQRTHDLKHHGWTPTRLPDGTTSWTSPAGQRTRTPRHTTPPPLPPPGTPLPDPDTQHHHDQHLLDQHDEPDDEPDQD